MSQSYCHSIVRPSNTRHSKNATSSNNTISANGSLSTRRTAEGGRGAFQDFVFVIPEHDVEVTAAAFDGGDLHRLGDAILAAPGEAERDVLQREVGKVMGAGILDLEIEAGIARQRGKALAEQLEERLVEHLLVLGLHDRVAQGQRGAGRGEHHADDDRHQAMAITSSSSVKAE